jgi:hypothetical protein
MVTLKQRRHGRPRERLRAFSGVKPPRFLRQQKNDPAFDRPGFGHHCPGSDLNFLEFECEAERA